MLLDQAILFSDKIPDDLIRYVGKYTINQEINGKREGVWKWYENGQLWYEQHYKEGKPHGISKGWFENGQLKSEHNWKEGQLHGICKWWSEDGQLLSEDHYEEGIWVA